LGKLLLAQEKIRKPTKASEGWRILGLTESEYHERRRPLPRMPWKITRVLRHDEILVLLFFAVAVGVSALYGYPLRYNILLDIIYHYFLVSPILLAYLFYTHITNPYLRFAWTILALGPSACLLLIAISDNLYGTWKHLPLKLILIASIFLWCGALVIYIIKKPTEGSPLFSRGKMSRCALSITGFLRDWWPIFIVLFAYCMLKSIIPVVNPRLYDEVFNTMDYFLFLKHYPTELSIEWIPVSWIHLLSFGYTSYFLLKVCAFSAVYCFGREARIFSDMVFAFSLTLILGMSLYFIVPAQGPIYYYPGQFESIQDPMSTTTTYKLQTDLWAVYKQVKQHSPREFSALTRQSGIRNGVAAFPSLHIAVSCVLLYFLFRCHPPTFWLFLFPFFLMLLATIYFGWHYVVDDLAGFVLAFFVLFLMNQAPNTGDSTVNLSSHV
jgi:membrane-associated phospholipid phosphatase